MDRHCSHTPGLNAQRKNWWDYVEHVCAYGRKPTPAIGVGMDAVASFGYLAVVVENCLLLAFASLDAGVAFLRTLMVETRTNIL